MRAPLLKTNRARLGRENYTKLRLEILQRDGWRCQLCGSMQDLHVHHITYRSHSGTDADLNLITLCAVCHGQVHTKRASGA